jgi:hypothetical protein
MKNKKKFSIDVTQEEIDKLSRTLIWVKEACQMGKDEELTIDKILFKLRASSKKFS